jgi:methionyl-tRNA synthetase
MINIDDFKKVEIKAGKILSVDFIEGSEKLLKLSVDFGEPEPRQVLSGIRKYFEDPQSLVGTTCAFVTNLEPRPMMGLESHGMILASSGETENGSFFSLLKMDCPPGSPVK